MSIFRKRRTSPASRAEGSRPAVQVGRRALGATAALVALATSSAALACRCAPLSPARALKLADAVVLARVEAASGGSHRLAVRESWKRRQPQRMVVFGEGTNCDLVLTPGREYLLYLTAKPSGGFTTSRCSGNLPAEQAGERLRSLRRT